VSGFMYHDMVDRYGISL